jgi:hypothetical protein
MKEGHIPMARQAGTLGIATWAVLLAAAGQANLVEDFESQPTSWQFAAADCQASLLAHRRVDSNARSGRRCERFVVRAAVGGTQVLVRHALPPCAVIEELTPRLWVKSDRAGIQLLARVVLPRTRDPETDQPASTLVAGQIYGQPYRWQELAVPRIDRLLEEKLRVLRARQRQPLDAAEAYVDTLVLNVYGGAGDTNVWIDDLAVDGLVRVAQVPGDAPDSARAPAAQPRAGNTPSASPIRRQGRLLLVDDRPFFPRVIEYRGEPLSMLVKLGFNSVALPTPPDAEQSRMAREHGLWIVCPPPRLAEVDWSLFDRVLAWHLGIAALDRSGPEPHELADQVGRADPWKRPLLCQDCGDSADLDRRIDIVLRSRAPLGTSLDLDRYESWLRGTSPSKQPTPILWSAVQSEAPPGVVTQLRAAFPDATEHPEPLVQWDQVRHLVRASLAAGAAGIWYPSRDSLAGDDAVAACRRALLERTNLELAWIQAWPMSGLPPETHAGQSDDLTPTSLATPRSRLAILRGSTDREQYVATPLSPRTASVILPAAPGSWTFRVGPEGLRAMDSRRVAGGIRFQLPDFTGHDLILVTHDEMVISRVGSQLRQGSQRSARLMHQLAATELEGLRRVLTGLQDDRQSRQRRLARTGRMQEDLDATAQALARGEIATALAGSGRLLQSVARLRHATWRQMTQLVTTPVESPFCVMFDLLPEHRQLVQRTTDADWGGNLLPGGGCEALPQMLQDGWRRSHLPHAHFRTRLSLSAEHTHAGNYALRMSAHQAGPDGPSHDTTALWVVSPPVRVEPGQLVRVSGCVRIDQELAGSVDGLMIYDSLGGPELAHRFRATDGWQPFVLYRFTDRPDHLTVTLSLHGLGEVLVDDLAVQVDESRARSPRPASSLGALPTQVR